MWSGFKSWSQSHKWVEFVVGSLPCSKRFFSRYSSYPLPSKLTLPNSNSIWNAQRRLNEFIRTLSASRVNKLQFLSENIFQNLYIVHILSSANVNY